MNLLSLSLALIATSSNMENDKIQRQMLNSATKH